MKDNMGTTILICGVFTMILSGSILMTIKKLPRNYKSSLFVFRGSITFFNFFYSTVISTLIFINIKKTNKPTVASFKLIRQFYQSDDMFFFNLDKNKHNITNYTLISNLFGVFTFFYYFGSCCSI